MRDLREIPLRYDDAVEQGIIDSRRSEMKKRTLLRRFLDSKHSELKKSIIIAVIFCGIAIMVLHSNYFTLAELEKQMQQNLEDVARQNAQILDTKISAKYELLSSLVKKLETTTPETMNEKLDEFKIFMEDFNLKRFAVTFAGGATYSTDGETEDLSYRAFYLEGMEGKAYITGVMNDAILEEHGQVNVMTVPIYDTSGNITGVFGVAYDTEEFNKSLQIESFDGQGYSCIVNESGEIMAVIDSDAFTLGNNIFDQLLEIDDKNEQILDNLKHQLTQKEEGRGTFYLSEKNYYYCVPMNLMDGSVTWYILTIIPASVIQTRAMPIQVNQYTTSIGVVILVGIGALMIVRIIKEKHEDMLSLAYVDPITGGDNFVKFCIDMECRRSPQGYLAVMEITNFDNITVVAGGDASNEMIAEIWKIISVSMKKDELAGHVKDDMFLMYLTASDMEELIQRMDQISDQINEKAKKLPVYGIHMEYGIFVMTGEDTVEEAYSKAKIAKEYATTRPELQYAFYSEVNRLQKQYEKQLEERFPIAVEKEEFEVWYQPKYSAADCKIVGSEALVRWREENGEMISPGQFIPLFERNGMIMKLDEYMFRSVCRQQKQWLDEGRTVYPVSVNISRASLYCKDVEKRYARIMEQYGVRPEYIQLEVTETIMEEKTEIYNLLNEFRQMGIKILMDDFGTGYSSLATLSTQCFDVLKLDKSLIDNIGSKDGDTLLYHIIRMGQQMGLHITAEGVERQTQLKFLQEMKCDDIQGYYFSKPVPKDEYEQMIN